MKITNNFCFNNTCFYEPGFSINPSYQGHPDTWDEKCDGSSGREIHPSLKVVVKGLFGKRGKRVNKDEILIDDRQLFHTTKISHTISKSTWKPMSL